MRKINPLALGATLFLPAIHKDLEVIVSGEKYPNLRSVVVDTEDALSEGDILEALRCIGTMLIHFKQTALYVFLRPRNIKTLEAFLRYKNIELLDGFILPKFSLDNADEYLNLLAPTRHNFMPSIEGSELFEQSKLLELREKLLPHKEKIILIRFGLEDMLRQLQMRRECEDSIFDFSVTNGVLGNFLAIFKSKGFSISGGVYPCFKDGDGFIKDVRRDMKEGLVSKTIIHPSQIEPINDLYKVRQKEYEESLEILKSSQQVFNQNNKMAEKTTMTPYAEKIILREKYYGTSE